MGRMLDSLRQAESPRNGQEKPAATAAATLHPELGVQAHEPQTERDEYPYIEVGGPDRKVDGSPAVLAAPLPRKYAPAAKVETIQVTATAPVGRELTLAVDFEPWTQPLPAHGLPGAEVICYHQPEHPASKQYNTLLEQMLALLPTDRPPMVLLAGMTSGSGTSTVLLNLAFTACLRRKLRVAMIDANLRQPALAERLSIIPSAGLAEVLTGGCALDAGLGKTLYPLLHILPAKPSSSPAEVLAVDALRWLTLRLRDRFDLVLVDGPHLGDHAELPALLTTSDGLFLIIKQEVMDDADRPKLAKVLSRLGASLKGLIRARLM